MSEIPLQWKMSMNREQKRCRQCNFDHCDLEMVGGCSCSFHAVSTIGLGRRIDIITGESTSVFIMCTIPDWAFFHLECIMSQRYEYTSRACTQSYFLANINAIWKLMRYAWLPSLMTFWFHLKILFPSSFSYHNELLPIQCTFPHPNACLNKEMPPSRSISSLSSGIRNFH